MRILWFLGARKGDFGLWPAVILKFSTPSSICFHWGPGGKMTLVTRFRLDIQQNYSPHWSKYSKKEKAVSCSFQIRKFPILIYQTKPMSSSKEKKYFLLIFLSVRIFEVLGWKCPLIARFPNFSYCCGYFQTKNVLQNSHREKMRIQ